MHGVKDTPQVAVIPVASSREMSVGIQAVLEWIRFFPLTSIAAWDDGADCCAVASKLAGYKFSN
jgi:hypothetical protein